MYLWLTAQFESEQKHCKFEVDVVAQWAKLLFVMPARPIREPGIMSYLCFQSILLIQMVLLAPDIVLTQIWLLGTFEK